MKISVYKKTDKYYQDHFNPEVETLEVKIAIDDIRLDITQQQCGVELISPHITFRYNDITYSMDFRTFIANAAKNF